jgi:hypothetical protein
MDQYSYAVIAFRGGIHHQAPSNYLKEGQIFSCPFVFFVVNDFAQN